MNDQSLIGNLSAVMERINKDDDENLNFEEFRELFYIFSEDIPE